MLSTFLQYVFVFLSTFYSCDSRMMMISIRLTVNGRGNQQYNVGEKPTVI